jgi:hypothetical protein
MNVENFLTIVHEIQSEEKHRTISIVQLIILLELFKAKGKPVSLLDIQYKYNFEGFTISRNCMMLLNGIKDSNQKKGIRKGKGWITKNHIGKDDQRMKEIKLTKIGSIFVKRLFSIIDSVK